MFPSASLSFFLSFFLDPSHRRAGALPAFFNRPIAPGPQQGRRRITLMKRVFTAALVASAFAVGLAARTPPQYPPASQPEKKAPAAKHSSTAGRSVTLTGCLREGATPGTFALSHVQWDRGGSRTSGTSGRAPQ